MRRAVVIACGLGLGCGRLDFDPIGPTSGDGVTGVFEPIVLPTGGQMNELVRATDGTLYAASGANRIWKSTNNGASWLECGVPGAEVQLMAIDASSGA